MFLIPVPEECSWLYPISPGAVSREWWILGWLSMIITSHSLCERMLILEEDRRSSWLFWDCLARCGGDRRWKTFWCYSCLWWWETTAASHSSWQYINSWVASYYLGETLSREQERDITKKVHTFMKGILFWNVWNYWNVLEDMVLTYFPLFFAMFMARKC